MIDKAGLRAGDTIRFTGNSAFFVPWRDYTVYRGRNGLVIYYKHGNSLPVDVLASKDWVPVSSATNIVPEPAVTPAVTVTFIKRIPEELVNGDVVRCTSPHRKWWTLGREYTIQHGLGLRITNDDGNAHGLSNVVNSDRFEFVRSAGDSVSAPKPEPTPPKRKSRFVDLWSGCKDSVCQMIGEYVYRSKAIQPRQG